MNLPAHLLSAYFICYHHGGGIRTGEEIYLSLPCSQNDVALPDLEPNWQECVINRYEAVSEQQIQMKN